MTLLVLLDTTILTNFALVELTSILRDLWGNRVATTEEVLEEYAAGVAAAKLPPQDWKHLKTITLSSEEQFFGIRMFPKLGRGERSCLAVAIVRGAMLATDDQLARRAALYQGIKLIGTIGILKTSVQSKFLSRIDAQLKLEEMIAAGYYSPVLKLDFD
jgi:predicted nucleic acid-binding protein